MKTLVRGKISTSYAENMGEIPWPERYLHLSAFHTANKVHEELMDKGKCKLIVSDYDARIIAVIMDWADKRKLHTSYKDNELIISIPPDADT